MTRDGRLGTVVLGVGSLFRRDDGVGEVIAHQVRARLAATARDQATVVALDGEPARLVELWDGAPLAVVIDAARSGGAAGQVRRTEVRPPAGAAALGHPAPTASTHGAGVAEALALGTALQRLPHRLVVYAVEGTDFGDGPGLSPAVAACVPRVVEQVLAEVTS
jgi:hydrogenase maturation protease